MYDESCEDTREGSLCEPSITQHFLGDLKLFSQTSRVSFEELSEWHVVEGDVDEDECCYHEWSR